MLAIDIKTALRRQTEGKIYARGVEYFQQGSAKEYEVSKNAARETISIKGVVKGGDRYRVSLIFDVQDSSFSLLSCNCPFGDGCKHTVALGLALAAYTESAEFFAEDSLVQEESCQEKESTEEALRALKNLGWSVEHIPQELIAKLARYKTPADTVKKKKSRIIDIVQSPKSASVFSAKNIRIAIDKYNGYTPRVQKKQDDHFFSENCKELLKNTELTQEQRALLEFIQEGSFESFDGETPDPAVFFPLLVASGFLIVDNSSNPFRINIQPEIFAGEIVYDPELMRGDAGRVRHNIFLRIPKTVFPEQDEYHGNSFFATKTCLLRKTKEGIDLYIFSKILLGAFSRLKPVYVDEYDWRKRKMLFYQTALLKEEIMHFDEFSAAAAKHLALTSPIPFYATKHIATCQPTITIEYDCDAKVITVTPEMDYGIFSQDITKSVYMGKKDGKQILVYRAPFEHPEKCIVVVRENILYYAQVDEKKEKRFFREMLNQASLFGFTKTIKSAYRGDVSVRMFLQTTWPEIRKYCQEHEYPMRFTKDALPLQQTNFRADFSVDIEKENGWLSFDVDCYCGEEKLTLEKLFAYQKSGLPFFRQADGTLIEIANRQDIDRLIRLLKSFEARENGEMQGRLYHAPEIQYFVTSSPHYNAVQAKAFQAFCTSVESGKPVKPVKISKQFSRILRPYQKAGVEWIYFLRSYHFAGILADDMGLGKTLQTLAVLTMERVVGRPSIVVCPKTLLYNWQKEASIFAPELKVLVMEGTPAERQAMRKQVKKYDVIVISYNTLKQDVEDILKTKVAFHYAILDEAQFIKNHATKNAQIVKKIPADFRLALTGTPLENSVSELWSVFDFLMPGFLGTHEHFVEHFQKPIMDSGDRKALEHLRRKVEHFMLRRTKAAVLTDLPAKIEQESLCILSDAQNILYQKILTDVRHDVMQAVETQGFKKSQIHILAGITKLRQACNHPALLTKEKDWRLFDSAKLERCLELLQEAKKSGRKVLIFSQFTQMLDIVAAALTEEHIAYTVLTGKTKNRQQVVDAFQSDPSITAFLISLKAGGTGLNLTAADIVIIFDPWWNPSVENQAVDRAHRFGQKKTVHVYRLLTSGTIEEKIQLLKAKKQKLFDAVVNESGDIFQKLTWDDIRGLFEENQ